MYRSSGPGGQSVNTTDSAVRVTHLPTGLVVACQDEKSQHKNRDKALKILRARLFDLLQEEAEREQAAARRSQVGGQVSAASAFVPIISPKGVSPITVSAQLYKIDLITDGDLDEIIDALTAAQQVEQLQEMVEI